MFCKYLFAFRIYREKVKCGIIAVRVFEYRFVISNRLNYFTFQEFRDNPSLIAKEGVGARTGPPKAITMFWISSSDPFPRIICSGRMRQTDAIACRRRSADGSG